MTRTLKPLAEQVVVVTGAASGIGLATARAAAARGARVVLAARDEGALRRLAEEIRGKGGQAHVVVADVGKPVDVARIAAEASRTFGGFDTWVNNAGIGIHGRLEDVSVEDMRRVFETNVWGEVYGSLEALRHLKARGGALINVGSEVPERAVPLRGMDCASKPALKGFTDALRIEIEDAGAPVSVTLIEPGRIDTPFPVNAGNDRDGEPRHVPPADAPEAVAEAILAAAATPARDVVVGGGAKAPNERGNEEDRVLETRLDAKAALNPLLTGAVVAGAGLLLGAIVKGTPRRPVTMRGGSGLPESTLPRALHIHLEARLGRESEVVGLLEDVLGSVRRETATAAWYAVRLGRSAFGVFAAFPDEAGREAHLAGEGVAVLMKRSGTLLAEPARIDRLDVLTSKAARDPPPAGRRTP